MTPPTRAKKTYGTLRFENSRWHFETTPVVSRRLLRLFTSANEIAATGTRRVVTIPHNGDNAEDVEWFLSRYPHDMPATHGSMLRSICRQHRTSHVEAETILQRADIPQPTGMNEEYPMRDYQLKARELGLNRRFLLLGDDMGLGKTATGISWLTDPRCRPALVVAYPHTTQQWVDQINMFAPGLRPHIVRTKKEYLMPKHDVAIITYGKLPAWAGKYPWKTVVYDEIQELRAGEETAKGRAAQLLTTCTDFRFGLSATPIYNYAGEMWCIINALHPGLLGTRDEFVREWGDGGPNGKVKDPAALGQFLRDEMVYLRRSRREVGRELPETNRVSQTIEFDGSVLQRLKEGGAAAKLARAVFEGAFTERGKAARQLDIMLRQATGIGKAPFVADVVRELADREKILLGGWHREVYKVWQDELERRDIPYVLYTGSETADAKAKAKKAFLDPKGAQVMIMSLRSGAGLDGLQDCCNTVVYGEMDWSPKVHDQFTGRLRRDGQRNQVNEIYLIANDGSDPVVANVLGVKNRQSTAVTDPDLLAQIHGFLGDTDELEDAVAVGRCKDLAKQWLAQLS